MFSSDRKDGFSIVKRVVKSLLLVVASCLTAASFAQAQVPAVNFSYPTQIAKSSSMGTNQDSGAAISRIATNQRGDLFWENTFPSAGGYYDFVELPAGSTTQVVILSHLTTLSISAVTDSYGNLWALTSRGSIVFIPFLGGSYASGIDVSVTTLPNCKVQGVAGINMATVNAIPCSYPGINGTNFGTYTALSDFNIDSAGDIIGASFADGFTPIYTKYRIMKYDAKTGIESVLVDGLPAASLHGHITLASNGDIYFADQAALYYIAAGASTFSILPGYSAPSGVSTDFGGNVYVTDSGNSRLVVFPAVNGIANQASAYSIAVPSSVGLFGSVGVDQYGTINFPGGGTGTNVWSMPVGVLKIPSVAVGATSATAPVNLTFTSAATFGNFTLTSSGGTVPFALAGTTTCTAKTAFAVGGTCSVGVNFKPSLAGPQSGTLSAFSSTGTLLGTARISGFGIGGLLNIDPGTITPIGSGGKAPSAITVDAGGNTYVADATTGGIYKNGNATAIATGFSAPTAIVVDGAGNLYVGDSGNGRIVEIPYSGAAYGTQAVIYKGLSGPSGLAIDASGNLYVADSGNARVLLLAAAGNLALGSEPTLVGSGYTKPVAVAVDNFGNVYVSDVGTGAIVQVNLPSGIKATIASSLKTAAGLTVDPGGSLYFVDSGTPSITRVPNIAGVVNGTGAATLASVVANPSGVAVDASGNLYAIDMADGLVAEMSRSTASLSFGKVVQGTTSQPQTARLSNTGTAAIALSNPYVVQTGNSDFSTQAASTCQNSGVIATGSSCSVVEVFTPSNLAAETASLSLASNGGTATLALSGTGGVLINATVTGPTTTVYGTPGTFNVTISPVVGSSYTVDFTSSLGITKTQAITLTNGTGTFTNPSTLGAGSYAVSLEGTLGSASFTVTKAILTATVLNATRPYGRSNPPLTCSFTAGIVNNDSLTCIGVTTATPSSNAGPYPITPTAVGAAAVNYTIAAPPISTYGTLTVAQSTANVSLGIVPMTLSAIGSILPGVNVTFTATIAALTGGTPTGQVTFVDVTYPNSPVALGPPVPLAANGTAVFSTSKLATGSFFIEAMYGGDVNFPPTNSIPTGITISPPTFTMALMPQALVISQGHLGSTSLLITPVGPFTAPITLSCAGLPLEATCTFGYPTVTLGSNPFSTTIVINTTSTASAAMARSVPQSRMGKIGVTFAALLAGFFTGFRRKRFRKGLYTFLLVVIFGLLPITGCGGLNEPNFVTPLGTYPSVTITGSSQSTGIVVPVTLRLTVTP